MVIYKLGKLGKVWFERYISEEIHIASEVIN